MDAVEVQRLKLRSAQALEANGDIEAAMDLRIAAEDWDEAVRTILQAGQRAAQQRTPADTGALDPSIASGGRGEPAMARLLARHGAVQTAPTRGIETLEAALALFRDTRGSAGQVLCLTALLNAAFLGLHALEAMDGWLDELLGSMERLQASSSSDVELRVWGVLCSALFGVRPWHPWTAAAHRVEALLASAAIRTSRSRQPRARWRHTR